MSRLPVSHYIVPELHISKIATHRSAQRQGGLALMEDRHISGRGKGIKHHHLEVRVSNTPRGTFYTRPIRIRMLYIRKRYYPDGADALVMGCAGEGSYWLLVSGAVGDRKNLRSVASGQWPGA